MRQQHVAEWMSTPPLIVEPSTSLEAAQRLMQQRHVRRLPVVADGRLIGIITRGDLRAAQPSAATTLSVYEVRALLNKVTVAACMTRDPLTVAPDASVLEAAQLILDHKVGGLPVVADGGVVGMITESDLFRLLIAGASEAERKRASAETESLRS
jgi:CBS domain-containing protein